MQLRLNAVETADGGSPERVTIDGTECLKVDVAASREQIYEYEDTADAEDREFLPGDELDAASERINAAGGLPISLDHPVAHGPAGLTPVSVSSPSALNTTDVGTFKDTHTAETPDGPKLSGKAYLRVNERATNGPLYQEAFDALEDGGNSVPVSLGYDVGELDRTAGTHNGEDFDAKQRDLKPDHLAIVLRGTARCGVADGCAAGRANAELPTGDNGEVTFRAMKQQTDEDDSRENALQRIMSGLRDLANGGAIDEKAYVAETSDNDPRTNAEKQRVKWESENGDTRYGLIADELAGDDQPDDKVLVAMYEYAPDEESESEKDDWQPMTDGDGNNQNARVDRDTLTEIEKFPSSPDRENASGEETAQDGDEPAEPGRDADDAGGADADTQDTEMTDPDTPDDEQMIETLVDEHGLDRENMAPLEGEECLGEIYQRFNAEAEGETESDSDEDATTDESSADETESGGEDTDEATDRETSDDPAVSFDTEEDFKEAVGDVVEQRENAQQQESLIDWIDSRSERYNAEMLEGTPSDVLSEIADDVAEEQRENAGPGAPTATPPQAQADRSAMQTGGPVRQNAERGDAPDVAVAGDPWGERNESEADD